MILENDDRKTCPYKIGDRIAFDLHHLKEPKDCIKILNGLV